ncbi:uncharacterized protein PHALS_07125 [Plasmopara halstedii]|uniref:WRKY19-like zinc finger domain-containing protein n=1 Tax=Plasmopara halstedii TaxID=4781 RepID=A0A0P1B3M8_PLAHL|nr:uncharacterized protein PHALS_07125 [Plasmopara halstedii]CEG49360.1 hypothetical protein PHALS_07125 [Plasmopara halstedii]|eukprot:XP_024585729.1 hypothetical protein PHALS_07125 [Plasmopara halstedii]
MPMPNSRRNANRARCRFTTCDKFAQTRGLCKAHGGGSRCRDLHCNKLAQSRGLCIAHGGGRLCQSEGCKKLAQSKGFCISHGGGRRCIIVNCEKFSQVKGRCKLHSKLVTAEVYSSHGIRTPPSSFGDSVISPISTKLSIDFLVNPLSHTSFIGDKVPTEKTTQVSTLRPRMQLASSSTAFGMICQPQLDKQVLGNQRSLLSFLQPSERFTSDSYASHDVAASEDYLLPNMPPPTMYR